MKFREITIKNFRGLKDLSFQCVDGINTIVGRNGIGKSSILDAIRLVKATLLTTTDNEAQQTLQSMGLYSPHTGELLYENIVGDSSKDTVIDLRIDIEVAELDIIKQDLLNFNIQRLQNQLGQNPLSRLNMISLLSSVEGRQRLDLVSNETKQLLKEFEKSYSAQIRLTMNINGLQGYNGFHQELVAFLLKSKEYSKTLFTVFPADRNFPTGDINIQLGQGEISQQILSYSISPQLKFQRLKAAIVSYMMLNDNNISPIKDDFRLIFDTLIPGKSLESIRMESRTGLLSVLIKENDTGAIYDIDFLSSGEKGLLLTFFLLLRTVHDKGIILLDEPELHLNPSVCRNIISFLFEHICLKKNAQIILTTHSSEILAKTKENENCRLFHLINDTTISPILKKDNEEAQGAIRSLGIQTYDLLFNKGVIYLEGTLDDEFLREMFKGTVTGFKIQSLGGRSVIENEVGILQKADNKGDLSGYHVFIIDFDNKPTSLRDSKNIKIIQWDRYSFENYLLNLNVLYDVVKQLNPKEFPSSRSEFITKIKELAFEQIDQLAYIEVSNDLTPTSVNITKRDFRARPLEDIASVIAEKIEILHKELTGFDKKAWTSKFALAANDKVAEMRADWDENWKIKCKGKELLNAIYNLYSLQNYSDFIKKVINVNREEDTEEWKILNSKIEPIKSKK